MRHSCCLSREIHGIGRIFDALDESGTSGDHSSYFAHSKFNVRYYVCEWRKKYIWLSFGDYTIKV